MLRSRSAVSSGTATMRDHGRMKPSSPPGPLPGCRRGGGIRDGLLVDAGQRLLQAVADSPAAAEHRSEHSMQSEQQQAPSRDGEDDALGATAGQQVPAWGRSW